MNPLSVFVIAFASFSSTAVILAAKSTQNTDTVVLVALIVIAVILLFATLWVSRVRREAREEHLLRQYWESQYHRLFTDWTNLLKYRRLDKTHREMSAPGPADPSEK